MLCEGGRTDFFQKSADNSILIRLGQEWVHRQTEYFTGSAFGFRELSRTITELGEDRLFVQAFRIVNCRGNTVFLQPGRHRIPVRKTQGVLRINMSVAG